jgi:hypothetical protein
MARCFDLPRIPSIIAAQLSIVLFGPAVRALDFVPSFASIPGLAVVYAPHLLAFGLLAKVSPEWPQVLSIAGVLLGLLFYSLYCDPLWTMVRGRLGLSRWCKRYAGQMEQARILVQVLRRRN